MKKEELKSTRDGFGEGIVLAAEHYSEIVVLTADLKESTRVTEFQRRFPDRFFDVGVSEQVLVTVASGMASCGKIPFAASFSVFSPGRNWEQIRTTICLNDVPVKIVGSHAGLSAVGDGASHQALEDIAMMRTLPNMVVISPCDAIQAKKAVLEIAKNKKPTYLRLFREPTPVITSEKASFKIGRADILKEPKDPQAVIIGTGPILSEALEAAKALKETEIETVVINLHTVKPIDEQTVTRAAKIAGAVVTIEEHQVAGGLGSAVAEVLAANFPVPIEMIGVRNSFGESGTYQELLKKHGLIKEGIVKAVKKVIVRKNNNL
jgi:transketolase